MQLLSTTLTKVLFGPHLNPNHLPPVTLSGAVRHVHAMRFGGGFRLMPVESDRRLSKTSTGLSR